MRTIILTICLLWAADAVSGLLFKEEVRGATRICYYQDGPNVIVKTLPASDPCPVTVN